MDFAVYCPYLELSISVLGISKCECETDQPTVHSLVRLHRRQAGLALYWWQKMIDFSSCRERVKFSPLSLEGYVGKFPAYISDTQDAHFHIINGIRWCLVRTIYRPKDVSFFAFKVYVITKI